ncbi:MAG: aldehyde dehydrogenase family protein [Phycisphaerales bacterium]|nr:aldehyde dehydrogenase family protein [Planctomycetota bacterium]MCH8509478.1 aldehyde dehydrogenase family protein [Phycisphaerales bacterium]
MDAVQNQRDAGWGLSERIGWAGRFARVLGQAEAELIDLACAEVHKTRWECLTAEIVPLANACRWHAKHARGVLAPRRVPWGGLLTMGQRQRMVRAPLGRVGIIATWNYPILLAGQHLVQSLVAGNRVVLKPSENSPRTQRRLAELAVEAGCPADWLEVIGSEREAGAALVRGEHGPIDHLVFTGSTEVGRAIAAELGARLIASTLELSGRDSALVLEDADPALAARSLWWAATTNGGQTCMAPRRALVHERVYDDFLKAMAPMSARAQDRRLISEAAAATVSEQAADAIDRGGRSLSGVFEPATGDRFRPVAVVDCPPDALLVEGRHFGPAIAVVRCGSLGAMLDIHDACDQRLVTSVFSRNTRRARGLAPRLGSNAVMVNDDIIPSAHPWTSIGGLGASGWGVTQGRMGLETLTRPVFVSTTSAKIRPPLDEPDPARQEKQASMLLRLGGAGKRNRRSGASEPPTSTATPAGSAGGAV